MTTVKRAFNADRASQPAAIAFARRATPATGSPVTPVEVYRKSKPVDTAQVSRRDRRWAMEHRFYLRLPTPLTPGQTYQIELADQDLSPLPLVYQPDRQVSEAVHVTAVGFRPDDRLRSAFYRPGWAQAAG
jgi:endoglucanase